MRSTVLDTAQRQQRLIDFQQLIKEMSNQLEVELLQNIGSAVDLKWQGNSVAILLDVDNSHNGIILSMTLGKIEAAAEKVVYPALLEGNYLWSSTRGATLAVNSESRESTINMPLNLCGMTAGELIESIENLHQTAVSWTQFIELMNNESNQAYSNQSIESSFLKV